MLIPFTLACLPALKPLLSLALKGTLRSSSGPSKPSKGAIGSGNAPRRKSNGGLGGFTDGGRITRGPSGMHKNTKETDDKRPFARLNETESNGGLEQEHELQDMSYGSGKSIMVTKQYSVE